MPLVLVTIPRLELMAAVLGLRLTLTLLRVLYTPYSKMAANQDGLGRVA